MIKKETIQKVVDTTVKEIEDMANEGELMTADLKELLLDLVHFIHTQW